MKILVMCAGGVSTNILAANMQKFADKTDVIKAVATFNSMPFIDGYDLVLVAPQICYSYDQIKEACDREDVLCHLLDMELYGHMDGKAIINLARDLIGNRTAKGEQSKVSKLKITLACAGGVSTSILCSKMIAAVKSHGIEEVECKAYSAAALKSAAPGSDVILLGPQVCYMEDEVVKQFPDIPVRLMDMRDYGTMNAENIVKKLFEEFQWK